MKDLYNILGVAKGSSQKEVKSAYRKLAKELHPDTNPGNDAVAERFKEVSAAYGILGDEKNRGRYDRGEIDAGGQERAHFGHGAGAHRGPGGESFGGEDFFSEIFGNFGRGGRRTGPRRNAPQKGRDRKFAVEVSFSEAATGNKRRLTLGAGGRTLDVTIPPGIEDGKKIRLSGQGDAGRNGGKAGDIMITVQVMPHPVFVREGKNVLLELPVSLSEAVLGARVKVPTVDGTVNVRIPAGSNTGTTLRLKGKGIGEAKSDARGDQMVRLKVVLPENQDADLKKWVSEWSEGHEYDPRSKFEEGDKR